MPEIIDLTAECPHCGEPKVLARAMAGAGSTYVIDRVVHCECGCTYTCCAAIVSGSKVAVNVAEIPAT